MTHKEAKEVIGQLRDLIQDRESHIKCEEYSDIYKRDVEALQFGINAIEQVENVKHGQWLNHRAVNLPYCSICGNYGDDEYDKTPYCPYCGARMDDDST